VQEVVFRCVRHLRQTRSVVAFECLGTPYRSEHLRRQITYFTQVHGSASYTLCDTSYLRPLDVGASCAASTRSDSHPPQFAPLAPKNRPGLDPNRPDTPQLRAITQRCSAVKRDEVSAKCSPVWPSAHPTHHSAFARPARYARPDSTGHPLCSRCGRVRNKRRVQRRQEKRNATKNIPNKPSFPHWRYRKRGSPWLRSPSRPKLTGPRMVPDCAAAAMSNEASQTPLPCRP
jgi:hypothetical protein